MFTLTPPVKVARTQRHNVSVQPVPMYSSARGAAGGLVQVAPTSIDESVILRCGDGHSARVMSPSLFLSGAGRHMCWLVDENTKLLRLWNISSPLWQRTQPRMTEIPYFAAAQEGLPLFVSEMDMVEESLAFCSERGAVSTLDHSVEMQVLEGDDTVSVSSFTCQRRTDCSDVIVTAIGTTAGVVVIDVKTGGEHFTSQFDRSSSPVHRANVGKATASGAHGSGGGAAATSSASPSWWNSFKSLVSGKPSPLPPEGRACIRGGEARGRVDEDSYSCAFTHVVLRQKHPDELVAVNGLSEVFLVEYSPLGHRDFTVGARWMTNIEDILFCSGRVVCVTESRHKVWVLFLREPNTDELPALVLVSLAASTGQVVNSVTINTIADVVTAAGEVPPHHIRVFADEKRSSALIFIRHFCVRVNGQVGVRRPCASDDTIVLEGLQCCFGSVLRPDGSVVSLGIDGPLQTLDCVHDGEGKATVSHHEADALNRSAFIGAVGAPEDGVDANRQVASIIAAVRADNKLSLDSAILSTSDDLAAEREAHSGNWARADLNADDENIILHVSRHLRRRQQSHRRFVLAVLHDAELSGRLLPSTVAQLISAQEALIGLVALRSLQNVGSVVEGSAAEMYRAVPQLASYYMNGSGPTLVRQEEQMMKLLHSTEHLSRCQGIMRHCILEVARNLRERGKHSGAGVGATAAELVFASPVNLGVLLATAAKYLVQVQQSAAVDAAEKFATAYAVGCLYVVVAQTIVESRDDFRKYCTLPPAVRGALWTSSAVDGSHSSATPLHFDFSFICVTLTDALRSTVECDGTLSGGGDDVEGEAAFGRRYATATTPQQQCELVDVAAYLTYFAFSNYSLGSSGVDSKEGSQYFSTALMQTFLRAPLVTTPFGYPFGEPRPPRYAPALGRHVLRVCESLALRFHAAEVLLTLCLARPVDDPLEQLDQYATLRDYCSDSPLMFCTALEGLWRQGREWELMCLSSIMQGYPNAVQLRDTFLETQAPHLLWLAAPKRFDGLVSEGRDAGASGVSYGPDRLAHCCRALAAARLAWVAAGASEGGRYSELELASTCALAQREFLAPECCDTVLGPQELVQRLIAKEDVAAWAAAAVVASRTHEVLSEDLLVQIVRRCRNFDGDALMRICVESVSELEVSTAVALTAIGRVIAAAAPLQDAGTLTRICETVLSVEEMVLAASWLATFFAT